MASMIDNIWADNKPRKKLLPAPQKKKVASLACQDLNKQFREAVVYNQAVIHRYGFTTRQSSSAHCPAADGSVPVLLTHAGPGEHHWILGDVRPGQ
jgi:hypothetical protein